MSQQVDALRRRVLYAPVRRSALGEVFADVELAAESIIRDASAVKSIRRRLGGSLPDLLADSYEAVALLVGSELDLATSGPRGLGRATEEIPRLAAAFRVDTASSKQLGPPMEDLCIAGFASAVVVDVIGRPQPTKFRHRPLDTLIEQWVTHGIGVWSDWPDEVLAIVSECTRTQRQEFVRVAERCGLVRRHRRRGDRKRLDRSGFMLLAAGANLLAAHSALNDDWFD